MPRTIHCMFQNGVKLLKMSLLQPSSGAAERVFSVLNNSFGKRQLSTLEDYVEASVMLQYNKRTND